MRVTVVVNESGGTAAAEGDKLDAVLRRAFEQAQLDADLRMVKPGNLPKAMDEAAQETGSDALVAGGGDGTISLAATAALRHDRTLGILPLGTLNHLARDAGIPSDLGAAVAVIAAGHSERIDVAEVNGHVFVNNSSVGLYPLMVREREAQQRRLGRSKRLAMLVATVRALHHFSRHRLAIRVSGREGIIETPLLFVGNNLYETSLMALGQRAALNQGVLCIYAPLARNRRQLVGLALRGLFGALHQQSDFVSLTAVQEATIDSARPTLNVSADGETLQLDTPLRYRIRPAALRLLVPASKADQPPERPASAGASGGTMNG